MPVRGKGLDVVAARLAETRHTERGQLEPFECKRCETKFYRASSFRDDVADWNETICFDCVVTSIIGMDGSIAFAHHFADPLIKCAFMMKVPEGWRFAVLRSDERIDTLTRPAFMARYVHHN